MKKVQSYIYLLIFVIIYLSSIPVSAFSITEKDQNTGNNDRILIITSYTPDAKRVTDFLDEFSSLRDKGSYKYNFVLENMKFMSIDDLPAWKLKLKNILNKYDDPNLKALIILGQEAWSTFLSLDTIPKVPFYVCYASEMGVILDDSIQSSATWNPKSVNLKDIAISRGTCGGSIFQFDFKESIDLIKSIYPSINKVALIADNSYGGISLCANFKEVIKNDFKNIEPILLDGRKMSPKEIKKKIDSFDKKTAIIIGSWRVDNTGAYILQGSINNLFSNNKVSPIFTISGLGFGTIALGGYFPNFDYDIQSILKNIDTIQKGKTPKTHFHIVPNEYIFDKRKMKEYGIQPYQLPSNSEIESPESEELERYKNYILGGIIAIIIFLYALIVSIFLFFRLKKANKKLELQKKELGEQKEALEEAKEEAVKSDKLKSAFLANMSHEIRTPLNAIVGFSELLKDGCEDDEKKEYWNIINTNSDLLLRLINDILDLSKIESGMLDFKEEQFDLVSCFNTIHASLKSRNHNKNVLFYVSCPCKKCIVSLDRNRINQVVSNFVTNAFKFTENGFVEIGFTLSPEGVTLYCKDSGIGIEEYKIHQVFERFYKLNDFAQGTGLGMSICKAIIEALNGSISVESTYGIGTTFKAFIPISYEKE